MSDRSSKTEQPTQRRLDKAREEGQFPAAREFVGALQFLVLLMLLGAGSGRWLEGFRIAARALFASAFGGDLTVEGTHPGHSAVVSGTSCFRSLQPGCL